MLKQIQICFNMLSTAFNMFQHCWNVRSNDPNISFNKCWANVGQMLKQMLKPFKRAFRGAGRLPSCRLKNTTIEFGFLISRIITLLVWIIVEPLQTDTLYNGHLQTTDCKSRSQFHLLSIFIIKSSIQRTLFLGRTENMQLELSPYNGQ